MQKLMVGDMMNTFSIGCNYWASNAGVHMWRQFDEAVVREDIKRLKECGIDTLRVFPLWTDFQPIVANCGPGRREMRINDLPLDSSPEGIAGVDPVMIERFEKLVRIAEEYDMKLLVCIINGWMSGKMYTPPAFYNKNVIIDKTAVKWTIRFVRYIVERFKDFKNIVAWEPGNETNVMCNSENMNASPDEYWVWLSTLVTTIKSVDSTRPVIAGMHGLSMNGGISPADVGELCDQMTVHPYPAFVPHCYVESLRSMKSRLHATAEAILYSDIGGKPCLCEEIGTLGNMLASNKKGADYLRVNTYSLWANGSTGIMWWCSHDQDIFTFAPYDWNGLERELGLMFSDGTYKETALEMKRLRDFVDKTEPLPERRRDAVCILSQHQDNWAVAYSSYVLAKQAGIELRFADGNGDIPESEIYMLPSMCGDAIPRRTWIELLDRVENDGAVLYMSWNDAFISSLQEIAGIEILGNSEGSAADVIFENGEKLPLYASRRLEFEADGSTVLARTESGAPALTVKEHGKGKIYFLAFAPELQLCDVKGAYECAPSKEYYKIYEMLLKPYTKGVVRAKSSPFVGVTEHPLTGGAVAVTIVNYIDEPIECELKIRGSLCGVRQGNAVQADDSIKVSLASGDICIFEIL